MNKYIKLPEYISSNEFELESDKYIEYTIKKKDDSYLLINKEYYEENESQAFWFIDDISKLVLNEYSNCIYALVSLNEDKTEVEVFLGQTFEPSNTNYYSFLKFEVKDINNIKKTIKIKLDFLNKLFNCNDGVVVYSTNINKNIIEDLFDKIKVLNTEDSFRKLLSKTKYYQKQYVSLLPYIVIFILSLITYMTINYFVEEYNNNLDKAFTTQSEYYQNEISKYNETNAKLKQSITHEKDKLKNTNLISDEMYKEVN